MSDRALRSLVSIARLVNLSPKSDRLRLAAQALEKCEAIYHDIQRRRVAGASDEELTAFAYDAFGTLGWSRDEITEFLAELAEGA